MGGGLMQLVAYGAQDIYLTGNPQITFFKVVYRRHTNFSMETIQQTINGTATIGSSANSGTVTISRNGDLVSNVYVRCDQDTSNGIKGEKLVTEVEIEIGGQRIDRHYEEWLQVWSELTTPSSKADGYAYMTGNLDNTFVTAAGHDTGNQTQQQSIMLPLQFWFCRNPGLALPLIALQYHEVKLKFTWGIDTDVSRDGTSATPTCEVWADYIYLDTDERRRFAQVSHEYLIEQLQRQNEGSAKSSYKLNFNHPVKELLWTNTSTNLTTQRTKLQLNGHDRFAEQDREYFQLRQPYQYHTSVPGFNIKERFLPTFINPIDTGIVAHNDTVTATKAKLEKTGVNAGKQITFDSAVAGYTPRVGDVLLISVGGLNDNDAFAAGELNQHVVQLKSVSADADPVCVFVTAINAAHVFSNLTDDDGLSVTCIARTQYRTNRCCTSLIKDINAYSFALKPEEHQPSGTCNFSRIDNAQLAFSDSTTIDNIYAVNYNVLRIMSGMGGLAYSN